MTPLDHRSAELAATKAPSVNRMSPDTLNRSTAFVAESLIRATYCEAFAKPPARAAARHEASAPASPPTAEPENWLDVANQKADPNRY